MRFTRPHLSAPRRGVRAVVVLCAAVGVAVAGPAPAGAAGLTTDAFGFSGTLQPWTVPSGVQSIAFEITGGAGGRPAGGSVTYATTATGVITIPPGVTALDVVVGGQGQGGFLGATGIGGWPNGGRGGGNGTYYGAGGGGSSDIRPSGAPFTSALIVMGGSGGGGGYGGVSDGGQGGLGGLQGAYFGQAGGGSDGGAGGAGGAMPTGTDGQGGTGQAGPNGNSGGGGGGGGGWYGGAGGGAGTADSWSFLSGGGGGGGGGVGMVVDQYVSGVTWFSANQLAVVRLSHLNVTVSTIPSLAVGTRATWEYDAGSRAVFEIASGALPPGLTFDGYSGQIQGVPTEAGTYTFTVAASVYPDGTNAVTTTRTTTVTVNTGGPASLVTTSATAIGTTSATANGAVLAGGSPVTGLECVFSTTNADPIVGTAVPASPASVNPTPTGAATPVSCSLGGLASNQTYYYQLRGTQLGATVRSGAPTPFTTGSAPARPVTIGATNVTATTATGDGTVSATQNVTNIVCKAATTLGGVATGSSFNATPLSTTGIVDEQPVTCAMTGLTPNAVYHFAFFATDASGTAISPTIQSFVTRVSPPQLGPISASAIGSTSATIAGTVTPTNEIVTGISCRYVAAPGNPARGTAVAATPFQLGSAAVEHATTCALSDLVPSTTYLVRMEATDRDGTASAPNVIRFTTAGAPAPPPPAPEITITSAFAMGTTRIRARATINGPGTLTLLASRATPRANRRAQVCRATRQLTAAGTYTITCRVNRATRRALRTRPLPIRVRVTYVSASGSAATQTMTVLLRRTKK